MMLSNHIGQFITTIVQVSHLPCYCSDAWLQVYTCYAHSSYSYDYDAFTREFYRLNFGVEDFTPVQVQQPPPRAVKQV